MSAANVLWLPLGELLVERGLLSKVQLGLALAEQKRTGRRLGEVLVALGFVSEPALARMLLEQVGLAEDRRAEEPPPVEPAPEPTPVLSPESAPAPVLPPAAVQYPPPPAAVAAAPAPVPMHIGPVSDAAPPEPRILRVDAPGMPREAEWSRRGRDEKIAELERVLAEFERRSREIENDITRVRGALHELREARA